MKVSVNRSALRKIFDRQGGPLLYPIYYKKIKEAVRAAQELLLAEFENHSVTKEIESGAGASNSSGTLGGYGDLYSFIGFDAGMDPIAPIRALLKKALTIRSLPANHRSAMQNFIIELPSKDEIFASTPMPWAQGRSWAEGIERGISGLGNYLSKESAASRSGGGIQTGGSIRGGGFENVKYLSEMLRNLQMNIRQLVRR